MVSIERRSCCPKDHSISATREKGAWRRRGIEMENHLPRWYLVRILDVADLPPGEFLVRPIQSVISFEGFRDVFGRPASEYARENVVDLLGEVFAVLRHGEGKRTKGTRESVRCGALCISPPAAPRCCRWTSNVRRCVWGWRVKSR